MGLVGVERRGVESDDLLAAEAVALSKKGDEVLIVSSDKDFAQIVSDRISILLPPPTANPKLGWRRMDAGGVIAKFGVPPSQIADYLAVVGDTSDNIPGIDGVGPKTATKWLQAYGGIEQLIANAGNLEPERFRTIVSADAEKLRRNLKITTLNLALEPVSGVDQTVQLAELLRLLEELEMKGALVEARKRYTQPELF